MAAVNEMRLPDFSVCLQAQAGIMPLKGKCIPRVQRVVLIGRAYKHQRRYYEKIWIYQKIGVTTATIASTIIFTIGVSAVDYSGNIYYTGSYDCSPNSEGFITIEKERIGVMAFMTDMNVFIRATTNVGGDNIKLFYH